MPGLAILPVGVLVDIVVTLVHPPGVATVTADLLTLVLGEALLLVVVIVAPAMTCVYPASNRGATAGAVLLILVVGLILALVLHRVEVGPGVSSVVDPLLSTAGADLLSLLLVGVGRVRTILSRIRHLPGMGVSIVRVYDSTPATMGRISMSALNADSATVNTNPAITGAKGGTTTTGNIASACGKGAGHKADNYDGQGQRHHSKILNPLHNILLS